MKITNRKKIEGTPFDVCQVEESGKYVATIGAAVLTREYDNESDVIAVIQAKDWELIFNTICYVNWLIEQKKGDKENA